MRNSLVAAIVLLTCCAALAAQETGWPQEIRSDQVSILLYRRNRYSARLIRSDRLLPLRPLPLLLLGVYYAPNDYMS